MMIGVAGLLCVCTAFVVSSRTGADLVELIGGVTTLAGGYALFAVARALEKDGYCRSFFERFVGEFGDPPLGVWEDELEERAAFENSVSGSEKVIADD